ncbi:phage major capsid protein [Actinomadura algeriensis]|uniref:HK97 family phage major capsid protein n=1 Tax=Actinomadura algeriensis TaxID=1679523 RepID=A0ABR9JKQ8_9ACTN|nr:phage major capsid protein [Actinomadura algeriensis]MBE1531145.1 HK97 family phage major capsid protein [Actinomadura algeriensis]
MAVHTTGTSAKAWAPDVTTFAPADAVPEALILQTSTVAGSVEGDAPAVRCAYVDDADAEFVAEGADIPESDPALSEVLVYTGKISQLVRLSREQFEQDGTEDRLAVSVGRAVTRRANTAYLTQAAPAVGETTPPAGILNITGITAGGAVTGNLDVLVDLLATLQGNDAEPSHIITDPTGWATLRKMKTDATDSNESLLGAGTTDATRMLLDLPVVVSPAMTAGTGLVVDRTAVVSAVGSVLVAVSEHVYFTADSIGLRCTWRIGWNVVRPERIGSFTITPPAP